MRKRLRFEKPSRNSKTNFHRQCRHNLVAVCRPRGFQNLSAYAMPDLAIEHNQRRVDCGRDSFLRSCNQAAKFFQQDISPSELAITGASDGTFGFSLLRLLPCGQSITKQKSRNSKGNRGFSNRQNSVEKCKSRQQSPLQPLTGFDAVNQSGGSLHLRTTRRLGGDMRSGLSRRPSAANAIPGSACERTEPSVAARSDHVSGSMHERQLPS